MKGKSRPEVYILFYLGFKPKALIKLGYNKHTIYNYHRRFNSEIKTNVFKVLESKVKE